MIGDRVNMPVANEKYYVHDAIEFALLLYYNVVEF